jgi:hypothetical protein
MEHPTKKPTSTERPTRTPVPPTRTPTPPIPICCQCGFTNLPTCFDTVFPEPCSPVNCVANVGASCGPDGLCVP